MQKIMGVWLALFLLGITSVGEACMFEWEVLYKDNEATDWNVWQRQDTQPIENGLYGIMANMGYIGIQGAMFWFSNFHCFPERATADVSLQINPWPVTDNRWDVVWRREQAFDYQTEYEFTYTIHDRNFLTKVTFHR